MTQAIELPKGTARGRELYRLTDLHAAAEASAALHAASERTPEGVVGAALAAADTLLGGIADDGEARESLRNAVTSPEFRTILPAWMRELRQVASTQPDTGACTVATALKLWSWTLGHLPADPQLADEMAEAAAPLLAARCFALDVAKGSAARRDLSHVYAARVSAQVGTTCAELVFGHRKHLTWDSEGCATCFAAEELDGIEAIVPGFASGGRAISDVVESDGSHPAKEGPCANFTGLETFLRLRKRLDGCLTGARIAKDRAAAAIASNERSAG
jgi:hypothetical protein